MRAVGKSRQKACRQEHMGPDTTGRRWAGLGSHGARGTLWREVERPGAPDAKDQRQRGLRRSGRTGAKEQTGFGQTGARYVR